MARVIPQDDGRTVHILAADADAPYEVDIGSREAPQFIVVAHGRGGGQVYVRLIRAVDGLLRYMRTDPHFVPGVRGVQSDKFTYVMEPPPPLDALRRQLAAVDARFADDMDRSLCDVFALPGFPLAGSCGLYAGVLRLQVRVTAAPCRVHMREHPELFFAVNFTPTHSLHQGFVRPLP